MTDTTTEEREAQLEQLRALTTKLQTEATLALLDMLKRRHEIDLTEADVEKRLEDIRLAALDTQKRRQDLALGPWVLTTSAVGATAAILAAFAAVLHYWGWH